MGPRVPGTSQQAVVRLVYRRAAGATLGVGSIGVALFGLPAVWQESLLDQLTTVLLIVTWVALAARLWLTADGGTLTAVGLAVVAVMPLILLGSPAPPGVDPLIAVAPAVVAVVSAVVLVDPPGSFALAISVFLATFISLWVSSDLLTATIGTWPIIAFGLTATGAKIGLHRAAVRADLEVIRHRAVELTLIAARAQQDAHSVWQGLLHDEIAAALRTAATPGVEPQEIRRVAQEAVDAVRDVAVAVDSDRIDVMAGLREVVSAQPVPISVDGPSEVVIPARVAVAVVGSVVEALRNVARHGAGAPARVGVRRHHEELTIEIVDDGPGFDLDAVHHVGGLQISVMDRMAQVGGRAEVSSTVGRGTVVRLTWVPGGAETTTESFVDVPRVLGISALPLLVVAGVLVIAQQFTDPGPMSALGASWFAAEAVITVAVVRTCGHPFTHRYLPHVLALMVLGTFITVVAGLEWNDTYRTWPLIAAGPALLIGVLHRPVWHGLTATALILAGTITMEGGYLHSATLTALVVTLGMVILGASIAWVMDRLTLEVVQAANDERRQLEESWRQSVHRDVYLRRRGRLEEIVVPYLRGLCDDSAPVGTAESQAEAARLEQSVRDEMHLPGVLDAPTRALVSQARADGCRIRFQNDSSATNLPSEQICRIVQMALVEPEPRQLTVSVYSNGEEPSVSVVAMPGHRGCGLALGQAFGSHLLVLQDEEESTWAEIALDHVPDGTVR